MTATRQPRRPPHLLVAISAHGFGHVAQAAPVVKALRRLLPDLRVTLRTAAPRALLDSRFDAPFALQPVSDDIGMCQSSALEVDVAASAAAYRELHRDWERKVERVARELRDAAVDLVLADVPYLTLAGAARAAIPAYALCSLHWADIYRHYCGDRPEAEEIAAAMEAAYRSARLFLRPTPSMPMDSLPNTRAIGPIALPGRERREELARRFGVRREERLVVAAFGGIAAHCPFDRWPALDNVRWVVPRDWISGRADTLAIEDIGIAFSDLLASCDLLLTKPGYGSFAEAALLGLPVLYVPRGDWPEEPFLVEWLRRVGRCAALSRAEMEEGAFSDRLVALLAQGRGAGVAATGVEEAARLLDEALRSL